MQDNLKFFYIGGNSSCHNHRAIIQTNPHFTFFMGVGSTQKKDNQQDDSYNLIVKKEHFFVVNMHIITYNKRTYHQFIEGVYIQYYNKKENSLKRENIRIDDIRFEKNKKYQFHLNIKNKEHERVLEYLQAKNLFNIK